MRCLCQCCSSCHASAASFSLRLIVRADVTHEFLTSCCVIVEPPWTTLMFVKPFVLDVDDRVLHDRRDLVRLHEDAALGATQRREDRVVVVRVDVPVDLV